MATGAKDSAYLKARRKDLNRRAYRRAAARMRGTDTTCHICKEPIDTDLPHTDPMSYTVDHVIPATKGGTSALDNLKPAHRSCNSRKGDRPLEVESRTVHPAGGGPEKHGGRWGLPLTRDWFSSGL